MAIKIGDESVERGVGALFRSKSVLMATQGLDEDAAYARAAAEAEFFVLVAEIRTVAALPPHQQVQAGRLGLFKLDTLPGAPAGAGPFVVDLSRVTTVSNRVIERLLGRAAVALRHKLQATLCQHLAAPGTSS